MSGKKTMQTSTLHTGLSTESSPHQIWVRRAFKTHILSEMKYWRLISGFHNDSWVKFTDHCSTAPEYSSECSRLRCKKMAEHTSPKLICETNLKLCSTWTPDCATKLLSSASSASLRHVVLPQNGDTRTNNFRARSSSLLWHWLNTPVKHTQWGHVLSVEHHVCFTSVKSVVLYRWHDSRSDWRALACPRPRLHLFLPPPLSSGSYWRPERRTCSLYTEHMQMQIQRDATPHTHTHNYVQTVSVQGEVFWSPAPRQFQPAPYCSGRRPKGKGLRPRPSVHQHGPPRVALGKPSDF